MKNPFVIGGIAIAGAVVVLGAVLLFMGQGPTPLPSPPVPQPQAPAATNFEECVQARYPIVESYPRQCGPVGNRMFAEDIGNILEKQDFIRVSSPRPNEIAKNPLVVRGEARGMWYFEASFPLAVVDGKGKEIGRSYATAQGGWMTEEFVPFEGTVTFSAPETERGEILFIKDNPSGLPEYDDELRVPIRFSIDNGEPASCVITGCSGQICADEQAITTCEYSPEYACYRSARCERQANGACAWTMTPELAQCLSNPPSL